MTSAGSAPPVPAGHGTATDGLPPLRDGNVSPDAARCSYADANGAKVTHLAGKVLAEGGPGDPGVGVADVKVAVHAVEGPLFVGLLVTVIIIVGALTFFPALSLSPIAEHFMLR